MDSLYAVQKKNAIVYYVYILSNWDDSVLYIGVTNNLLRRLWEHRNKAVEEKYNTDKLVYFEQTTDSYAAISRDKQLKNWNRSKKNALISRMNPEWKDISADWD